MTQFKNKQLSNPALLQKIDELRERNIGQHVPLPQLVVVGDQSSGKSALLESLTGIPFPRNVELCTRHATQITSRRDSQHRVEISITPGPNASVEHKKHVESYTEVFATGKDISNRFSDILAKVSKRMGIRTDISSNSGSVFSEDVLKIEICGPDEEYLTVIDVPGIFRTPTEGITTQDDITLVNNLVQQYIRNRRTIILAVLPSNVDIATQVIIALAREHDPAGERTLGVLTKPDLVKELTAKNSVCDLVAEKRMPLKLGYYLVRNRGADDGDNVKQQVLENMFTEQPWARLSPDRVGILALKDRLQSLLAEITQQEFPSLRMEIQSQANECQKELDGIGPARNDEREQRRFLSDIAKSFEDLARRAIDAQYSHHHLFEDHSTRLVTRLLKLTDAFNQSFRQYGLHRTFEDVESKEASADVNEEQLEDDSEGASFNFRKDLLQGLYGNNNQDNGNYPELEGLLARDITIQSPVRGIMDWIKELYLQSRGIHLGTFNPELLSAAFAEQSDQWSKMVQVYMGEVVRLLHHFVTKALECFCHDKNVIKEIWSEILEDMVDKYKAGLGEALLLVDVERHYPPYTMNDIFYKEVNRSWGNRIKAQLEPFSWRAKKDDSGYVSPRLVVNLDAVPAAATAQGNEECLKEEIHDKLHSYYHLAADRVIDNIFRRAVCHQLLKGPQSPLTVFSQRWVIDLDGAKLKLIAGETEAVTKRRQVLNKKLRDLKHAINVLKG